MRKREKSLDEKVAAAIAQSRKITNAARKWKHAVAISNVTLASAVETGIIQRAVLSDVLDSLPRQPTEVESIRIAMDSLNFNATLSAFENVRTVLLRPHFYRLATILDVVAHGIAGFQDTVRSESQAKAKTLDDTGLWSIYPLMQIIRGNDPQLSFTATGGFPEAPVAYIFAITPNVSVQTLKQLTKILTKENRHTYEFGFLPGHELVAEMHKYATHVIESSWPPDYELKIRRGTGGGYENYALQLRRELQERMLALSVFSNPTPLTASAKPHPATISQKVFKPPLVIDDDQSSYGLLYPLSDWVKLVSRPIDMNTLKKGLFYLATEMRIKLDPEEMLEWAKSRDEHKISDSKLDRDYGYPSSYRYPSYILFQTIRNGVSIKAFEQAYIALASAYEAPEEDEDPALHFSELKRLRDVYAEGYPIIAMYASAWVTCKTCATRREAIKMKHFATLIQEREKEKESESFWLQEWASAEERQRAFKERMKAESFEEWQKSEDEEWMVSNWGKQKTKRENKIKREIEKLGREMPRRMHRGHAHQDPKTREITVNVGLHTERKFMLKKKYLLDAEELDLLQAVAEVIDSSCAVEVLIDMHGEISMHKELITAPTGMCVEIVRAAPSGCVAFHNHDPNTLADFFWNLHTRGKTKISEHFYRIQSEEARSNSDSYRAERSKLKSFINSESIRTRGEFCRPVACAAEQRFFNKNYETDTWSAITIQNFAETAYRDLFLIMHKCGYTTTAKQIDRASLFQFLWDLGVRAVTLYDQSCAALVTDGLDAAAEADYLYLHRDVMGGGSSKGKGMKAAIATPKQARTTSSFVRSHVKAVAPKTRAVKKNSLSLLQHKK